MTVEIKPSIFERTTFANVAAFIIVVGGLFFGFYTRDADMVKAFTFIGTGYLFGKASA